MEDMLQKQIQYSCRLALPEGLQDLISDISREVLRAQPSDLYNFIVDYLKALLLARDALSNACQICRDICECTSKPELDAELRNLGLEGDDLDTIKNVVMEYFDKDEVNEGNLLMKLLQKTSIDEDMLPAIQEAVRTAFLKHQLENKSMIRVKEEKASERGRQAAEKTFNIYEDAKVKQEKTKEKAARTIQACFRAYLIRRNLKPKSKHTEKSIKVKSSDEGVSSLKKSWKDEPAPKPSTSKPARNNFGRLSSTTLAGSLIHLPRYIPYSVHDLTFAEFEDHETERSNIDYTIETYSKDAKDERKKIVFHQQHILHEIDSHSFGEEEYCEEKIVQEEIVEEGRDEEIVGEDQGEEIVEKGRAEEIVEEGRCEEIVAEEIQSNASEEILEVEEEVTNEKIIVNDVILELDSIFFGENEREIETIKHNSVEENTPNSEVSFLDEMVEEENKMKLLGEEMRGQEESAEEMNYEENYYNDDHLNKLSITSSKKMIYFFGE